MSKALIIKAEESLAIARYLKVLNINPPFLRQLYSLALNTENTTVYNPAAIVKGTRRGYSTVEEKYLSWGG